MNTFLKLRFCKLRYFNANHTESEREDKSLLYNYSDVEAATFSKQKQMHSEQLDCFYGDWGELEGSWRIYLLWFKKEANARIKDIDVCGRILEVRVHGSLLKAVPECDESFSVPPASS